MNPGTPLSPTHPSDVSEPMGVGRPSGWVLLVAASLALVLSVGLYGAGIVLADGHPDLARWIARALNVMSGGSATLACLTVLVTFTEGTAARKFETFFGSLADAKDGVRERLAAPLFVMTGALFGFGTAIAGTLGEDWTDPLDVHEWAYWLGGLFATLVIAALLALRVERQGTNSND